jgi:Na+-transporting NADH:ubiquinone oxidoreductase subunit NqrB
MNPEPFVNPPVYTIIMVTNFFAIAFGFIFKDMLEYQVAKWNTNRQSEKQITYDIPNIRIAYIGMCTFISLFMGASLSVFGLTSWLSYTIGAVIVLLPALLVWVQLGSMLSLLVSGGSEAVDIDSYGAGQKFDVQAPKPSK